MFSPQEEFSKEQLVKLNALGRVTFVPERREYEMADLIKLCADADILGFDPDPVGGFDKSRARLLELVQNMPKLKGVALGTTAFGYIDHTYCAKRHIPITNVPHYSRESVAEHVFALLLGAAKRVIITDRKTQQNKYELTVGTEIRGKTLGVIGYGSIGSRVAEIGNAFGMKVLAYNRTPKKAKGVTFISLSTLLKKSDAISINLSHSKDTLNFLSSKRIKQLKKGVIIINTADNTLVDEHAIARALNAGKIDSYVAEVDDVNAKPLCAAKNAFLLKGFGWYTKEALSRNKDIWIENVKSLISGKPLDVVC